MCPEGAHGINHLEHGASYRPARCRWRAFGEPDDLDASTTDPKAAWALENHWVAYAWTEPGAAGKRLIAILPYGVVRWAPIDDGAPDWGDVSGGDAAGARVHAPGFLGRSRCSRHRAWLTCTTPSPQDFPTIRELAQRRTPADTTSTITISTGQTHPFAGSFPAHSAPCRMRMMRRAQCDCLHDQRP
jgi:hypothetical protein